jgi:Trypsin-like peptidase domain/MAP3K TRAFs-binding domain
MNAQLENLITRIHVAIKEGNRLEASNIVQKIINSNEPNGVIQSNDTEKLIAGLNKNRWFDLSGKLGAVSSIRDASRATRKLLAQALIDTGNLDAAKRELERQYAEQLTSDERSEVIGLLGRIRKQTFINDLQYWGKADALMLEKAIKPYWDGYTGDRSRTWHGINVVALLKRAEKEGIKITNQTDTTDLANEILHTLELKKGTSAWDAWDFATAGEAKLALDNFKEAGEFLKLYALDPETKAFHLGSTLRQFEEVWNLEQADESGQNILTLLRASLLEKEGGQISLNGKEVVRSLQKTAGDLQLEKVFGSDHFTTYERYRTGLKRCQCVVRIGRESSKGDGTGFLMRGSDLFPELGDQLILVTNAHVLNTDTTVGFHPQDINVYFHALENVSPNEPFAIKSILWISSKTDCDCTVAILDHYPADFRTDLPVAPAMPIRPDGISKPRVLIIGYPEGGTLSFSLNDNELLDYDERLLHYRAPTEGGSSGSPVFNQEWKLIGLHHGGGDSLAKLNGNTGTYQANEGIKIYAIRDKMKAEYKSGQTLWNLTK